MLRPRGLSSTSCTMRILPPCSASLQISKIYPPPRTTVNDNFKLTPSKFQHESRRTFFHLSSPHLTAKTRQGRLQHHMMGTTRKKGMFYYCFHKQIGKSANWQKYRERYVAPKEMEMKMRWIPTQRAVYRMGRESRAWYWLLPKALAEATTASEVLDAFVRFRHKHPKKVYHYLMALNRLIRVGGCDPADWRFKYITSRVEPLRFRIINMPRLCLMYGKLHATKDVRDMTRFLDRDLEKYSSQQLSFIVRGYSACKLKDDHLFLRVTKRITDILDYFEAMADQEKLLAGSSGAGDFSDAALGSSAFALDGGAASKCGPSHLNIDGLLIPESVELSAKVRDGPNFRHRVHKGLHQTKHERYHGTGKYAPEGGPSNRDRSKAYLYPRGITMSRAVDGEAAVAGAAPTVGESVERHGDDLRLKKRRIEEKKEMRKSIMRRSLSLRGGQDSNSMSSEGPGFGKFNSSSSLRNDELVSVENVSSSSRSKSTFNDSDFADFGSGQLSRLEDAEGIDPEDRKRILGSEFQSGAHNNSNSGQFSGPASASEEECPVFGSTANTRQLNPLLREHRYDIPPTIEELTQILEGFGICGFKHYNFCQRVAAEVIKRSWTETTDSHKKFFSHLRPASWRAPDAEDHIYAEGAGGTNGRILQAGSAVGDSAAGTSSYGVGSLNSGGGNLLGDNPGSHIPACNVQWDRGHLMLLTRMTVAFAQIGYLDYGWFNFVSQIMQARLISPVGAKSKGLVNVVAEAKHGGSKNQFLPEEATVVDTDGYKDSPKSGSDSDWAFEDTADASSTNSNLKSPSGTVASSNTTNTDSEYSEKVHFTSSPISHLNLRPSTIVDLLRGFQRAKINDMDLFSCVLAHVDRNLHDYPPNELAFIGAVCSRVLNCRLDESPEQSGSTGYRSGRIFKRMFQSIVLENEFLTYNGIAATASFASTVSVSLHGWEKISESLKADSNTPGTPDFVIDESDSAEERRAKATLHYPPANLWDVLAAGSHLRRSDNREKYPLARLFELFALFLGPTKFKENKALANVFCKHLHRHLQYLEPVDFSRFANALGKSDYYDERAISALKKWADKRREEFLRRKKDGGVCSEEWDRFEEKAAKLKLKYRQVEATL